MSDYDQAEDRYGRSLAIFREIGNQWGMASSLINLGRLASKQERYGAAGRAFQEALRLAIGTQATPQFAASEPESVAACQPHAERLLAWQAVGGARPAAYPGGLTAREVDVLRLVA